MAGRNTDEPHRAATPLELLFDLCFVVAVAQAAGELHHALSGHHLGRGLVGYAAVFFAIWWTWVNFTWFASAYDTDDVPYRLATLVEIAGALVLAAGVPRAFERSDFRVITLGYVVMRIALVSQWLRAAHGDVERRTTAVRFAVGVTTVQAAWVARLALPAGWRWPSFVALALADLAVPVFAERAQRTPYHRDHIAERYGLFTMIVLGESILSATVAVQGALDAGQRTSHLLGLAGFGLVIVFAMWWLYFDRVGGELITPGPMAFLWGYGHYVILGAAAAVGAGLAAGADGHLSDRATGLAVGIPVAVYLIAVWFLHVVGHERGLTALAYPIAAAGVLLAALSPAPLPLAALVLAGLVATTSPVVRRGG
jgi:low temperature requirement protein LtrA